MGEKTSHGGRGSAPGIAVGGDATELVPADCADPPVAIPVAGSGYAARPTRQRGARGHGSDTQKPPTLRVGGGKLLRLDSNQ